MRGNIGFRIKRFEFRDSPPGGGACSATSLPMVFVVLSRIRITGQQLNDPPVPFTAEVCSILLQSSVVTVDICQGYTVRVGELPLYVAKLGLAC